MQIHRPEKTGYEASASGTIAVRLRRGIVSAAGADRLDLLHRLSTGNIGSLKPGKEGTTVLTTEKGRIIDVLRVIARQDAILLLLEGKDTERVRSWIDKYTIMDDVTTTDCSQEYALFGLYGLTAGSVPQKLFSQPQPESGSVLSVDFDGEEVLFVRDTGLGGPGGLLALVPDHRAELFAQALSDAGIVTVDEETRQTLRVEAGRGEVGGELTEEYNPLEAGLVSHVSFTKGCYIGQEVIARLDTYDKVKRRLIGIRFDVEEADTQVPAEGRELVIKDVVENEPVGKVTSLALSPQFGLIGLGYVRSAYAVPEMEVVAGIEGSEEEPMRGRLVMLPFS